MAKSRAEYLLHPQPRPLSRSGWRVTIIALVVLVAAILTISIAYENEGDLNVTGGLEVPANPGITVTIQPLSLEPSTNTMTARLVFGVIGTDFIDPTSDTLLQNTRLTVATTEGNQEFYYPQGSHLGAAQVILGADGSVSSYPFDSYSSDLYVRAESVQRETGEPGLSQVPSRSEPRAQAASAAGTSPWTCPPRWTMALRLAWRSSAPSAPSSSRSSCSSR